MEGGNMRNRVVTAQKHHYNIPVNPLGMSQARVCFPFNLGQFTVGTYLTGLAFSHKHLFKSVHYVKLSTYCLPLCSFKKVKNRHGIPTK